MYYVTGEIKTGRVKINNKILSPDPSLKVAKLSPDGFAWGKSGQGPAQLSLAILLTATTKEDAERLYSDFKADFIGKYKEGKNFSHKVPIRKWLIKRGAKYATNDTGLTLYNPESDTAIGRACGEQCVKATTIDCNCACGGRNHGSQAVKAKKTARSTNGKNEATQAASLN